MWRREEEAITSQKEPDPDLAAALAQSKEASERAAATAEVMGAKLRQHVEALGKMLAEVDRDGNCQFKAIEVAAKDANLECPSADLLRVRSAFFLLSEREGVPAILRQ